MDAPKQYRTMTTHEFIAALQRFQHDAEHCNAVEVRWLGKALQPTLDAACEVGNSRLGPENRKAVNDFRAAELEKEIDRKRRDMEILERDLKKVRAA
jgi:hypothetical protein